MLKTSPIAIYLALEEVFLVYFVLLMTVKWLMCSLGINNTRVAESCGCVGSTVICTNKLTKMESVTIIAIC